MARQNSLNPGVVTSTFTLKPELKDALSKAVELAGLKFVSELLTVIAMNPEKAGAALAPLSEKYIEQRKVDRQTISDRLSVADKLTGMSPEQLASLIAAAKVRP